MNRIIPPVARTTRSKLLAGWKRTGPDKEGRIQVRETKAFLAGCDVRAQEMGLPNRSAYIVKMIKRGDPELEPLVDTLLAEGADNVGSAAHADN